MLNVISHIYNEEQLLPHWLKHHRDLFDYGVILDYNSQDRSVEIIRDMVPNWKIIKTYELFGAKRNDDMIQEIEESLPENDWKFVLNATEFLFCTDVRNYVSNLKTSSFSVDIYSIVDTEEERNIPLTDSCLLLQRHNGFLDASRHTRTFHREKNGAYTLGRHDTRLPNNIKVDDLFVFWYGFSPFNEKGIQRKLQIKNKMTLLDKMTRMGWEHLRTEEELFAEYKRMQSLSSDLSEIEKLKYTFKELRVRECYYNAI